MAVSAYASSFTASPTGRSSATLVALGLNTTITPQTTGRVAIFCSGLCAESLTTDGMAYQLYFGTGAAPANNAAVTGTAIGNLVSVPSLVTSALAVPFAIHGAITGLSLPSISSTGVTGAATPYWIDIMFEYVTGAGTVTFSSVSLFAFEF